MSSFEHFLGLAKKQLPNAFATGGLLPFSDERRRLREVESERIVAELADEGLLPTGDEDLADFEAANGELGFEAIAFYVSFHKPTPDSDWGIFYWDHRLRQFAQKVRRELGVGNQRLAARLAFEVVRRHELFHFRFDAYAVNQELTLGKPLYNPYSANVYNQVLCTDECYEEALANRSCVYSSYGNQPGIPSHLVRSFVRKLCEHSPPGYRDFDQPVEHLRSRLGGQLIYGNAKGRLPEAQASWVGKPVPNWRAASCPEHVLVNRPATRSDVMQFRVKRRGRVWDFHKNDPDPWPSQPHGHDQNGYKLDLGDGTIYDPRTREPVEKEQPKILTELRERVRRQWPEVSLPELRT